MTMMTIEQVRAMPDTAYMNGDQLNFFKHYLQNLKSETETHIQEVRAQLQNEAHPMDESDQATLEETCTN